MFVIAKVMLTKMLLEVVMVKWLLTMPVPLEPACGAAVAAVHGGWVAGMEEKGGLQGEGPIVIVLCGGEL